MKNIISKRDAMLAGLKTYYTGIPCNQGHKTEILLNNDMCVVCLRLKGKNKFKRITFTLRNAPWKIMTREKALKLEAVKYYTGSHCINGHVSQRYTLSGLCVSCNNMKKPDRAGKIRVISWIHPDDAPMIEDLATALNTGRNLVK